MLENRSMRMMLQRLPKHLFAIIFGSFFILFLLAVILGVIGPQVWERKELSSWNCGENPPAEFDANVCEGVNLLTSNDDDVNVFRATVSNLDRLNQQIQIQLAARNPQEQKASVSFQMALSIRGRKTADSDWEEMKALEPHEREIECYEGVEWCRDVTVAHLVFLDHTEYEFSFSLTETASAKGVLGDMVFKVFYMNHSYTLYELWWRFVFLLLNFIFVVAYAHRLRNFEWREWTVEQKWTGILLFGLLAFNNPFFPLELLTGGWFPIFLNYAFFFSFGAMLLLYWLVIFDGIRVEDADRSFLKFYLPKIAVIFIWWSFGVAAATWAELHEIDDPSAPAVSTLGGFVALQVFELVALVIYLFWLVFVACRACSDSRVMPYLGQRVKLFFGLSFFVLLLTVGGLILGYELGGENATAAEFLSFQALMNLYVFVLAICYAPADDVPSVTTRVRSDADQSGMVRLDDESDSSGSEDSSTPNKKDKLELDTIEVGLSDSE